MIIMNSSNSDCVDPVQAWTNVIPSLKDFGIIGNLSIKYHDFSSETLQSNSSWKRFLSHTRGACYSLTLPLKLREKPIYFMTFRIDLNKTFEVFLHSNGLLVKNPYLTLDYFATSLDPDKSLRIWVDYQEKTFLDLDGKECQSDPDYNFIECMEDVIQEVLLLDTFSL